MRLDGPRYIWLFSTSNVLVAVVFGDPSLSLEHQSCSVIKIYSEGRE